MEEGLSELNMWLVRGLYIFGIIIAVFIWMAVMKRYYANQVVGKILAEFITPEGNSYPELLKCEGGMIIIPPKGDIPGKEYAMADIATYHVDYPAVPKMFSFIQTKAKKAVFFEDCWEPISNRSGKLILNPRRLYSLLNEKVTAVAAFKAMGEGLPKPAHKNYNIPWKVIIILGLIAAAVAIGYFVVQNVGVDTLTGPQLAP